MVSPSAIREANARFQAAHHTGLVLVFAGATSGIGAGTLDRVAAMVFDSVIYVLGRSAARFAPTKARLEALHPSLTIVFLELDVSLLRDVDEACGRIKARETKVDWLFMSQGQLPWGGATYTAENLELNFVLSYYSRMRLTTNLLPLLQQSPQHPRVLAVLNAGHETKPLLESDLGLSSSPSSWSVPNLINHTTTMTSLALVHLARHAPRIAFLHSSPGLVATGIVARLRPAPDASFLWRLLVALMRPLLALIIRVAAIDVGESGERHAYLLAAEEGWEPGMAVRVDAKCEVLEMTPLLEGYVQKGMPERVWEHTVGVFERVLGG